MAQYYPVESLEDAEFLRGFNSRGEPVAFAKLSRRVAGEEPDYATQVHIVFQMSELLQYIMFRERLHAHYHGA
jgi:hypothetical protein